MVSSVESAPKLTPALLGGLFIGVLSALPLVNFGNYCCCLWVIGGGMLAAYVSQQNHPAPITIGDGVIVGFGAGLVGGLVSFLLSIPLAIYLGPMMQAFYHDMVRSGGRQELPPEARQVLRQLGPSGMLIVGGVLFGLVSTIFGTLGGLLGALFFRTSPPPAPPPVVPPPPPAWTPPPAPPESSSTFQE